MSREPGENGAIVKSRGLRLPEVPQTGLRPTVRANQVKQVAIEIPRSKWILLMVGVLAGSVALTFLSYSIGSQAMAMGDDNQKPINGSSTAAAIAKGSSIMAGHFLLMLANQMLPSTQVILSQDRLFSRANRGQRLMAGVYAGVVVLVPLGINASWCWVHCSPNSLATVGPYLLALWGTQIVNQIPLSLQGAIGCCRPHTALVLPEDPSARDVAERVSMAGASGKYCPTAWAGLLQSGPVVVAYKEGAATQPERRVVTKQELGIFLSGLVIHVGMGGLMHVVCNLEAMPEMGQMNHWAGWGAVLISAAPAARRAMEFFRQKTLRSGVALASQLGFSWCAMMVCCMSPEAAFGVFLAIGYNACHSSSRAAVPRSEAWFEEHQRGNRHQAAESTGPRKPSLCDSLRRFFRRLCGGRRGGRSNTASLLANDHFDGLSDNFDGGAGKSTADGSYQPPDVVDLNASTDYKELGLL